MHTRPIGRTVQLGARRRCVLPRWHPAVAQPVEACICIAVVNTCRHERLAHTWAGTPGTIRCAKCGGAVVGGKQHVCSPGKEVAEPRPPSRSSHAAKDKPTRGNTAREVMSHQHQQSFSYGPSRQLVRSSPHNLLGPRACQGQPCATIPARFPRTILLPYQHTLSFAPQVSGSLAQPPLAKPSCRRRASTQSSFKPACAVCGSFAKGLACSCSRSPPPPSRIDALDCAGREKTPWCGDGAAGIDAGAAADNATAVEADASSGGVGISERPTRQGPKVRTTWQDSGACVTMCCR